MLPDNYITLPEKVQQISRLRGNGFGVFTFWKKCLMINEGNVMEEL